jgi:acyl-CoA thioester hydrolase
MHEKRIEIRWRDLDGFGHVNNAVYSTYLEEVRDEWISRIVGEALEDYVLVHLAIDFRRELTQDDDQVVVSCRLERIGRSSVHTREEIRALDGTLAAESESVVVARDLSTGRSRPLTEPERTAFERELESTRA